MNTDFRLVNILSQRNPPKITKSNLPDLPDPPLALKDSWSSLQLGQDYFAYTPKKDFCIFFNSPGFQKPRRNYLSNKSCWAI